MDFFQQQLNKNREAFISVREAITGLQEGSPKSSVATIAQALLQLEGIEYATARISDDISKKVHDWAPCSRLLSEIAYFGDVREIAFHSPEQWEHEAFPDGKLSPDCIGWHREDFIELLLENGWPVPDSIHRFNGTQKNNIPDWFKLYLTRPSLGIDEAGWIIAKNNFTGDAGDFKWAIKEFKFMLRESVKEGLINLSINGGSIIDDENYWRLDVQDIRRLCHNSELAWPIPWEEETDQPLSSKASKLQEQVKQLQEQVKQFENQAKELETLKQENAELKAKIEALSDGQNPDVDIASGLVFHHETQYLKLVSAVQERYYHPDRFDLTDKSTLPKKEDVKEWLIKNYRLTGAFADAVERVACPVDRAK